MGIKSNPKGGRKEDNSDEIKSEREWKKTTYMGESKPSPVSLAQLPSCCDGR
jgi:hypothetical protein